MHYPPQRRPIQVLRILQQPIYSQLSFTPAIGMADTGTLKRYFRSGQRCPTTLTTVPRRHSLLGTVFVTSSAELLHLVFQKSETYLCATK